MIEFAIDKFDFSRGHLLGHPYGNVDEFRKFAMGQLSLFKKSNRYIISDRLLGAMKNTDPDNRIFEKEVMEKHIEFDTVDENIINNSYVFCMPTSKIYWNLLGYRDADHYNEYNISEFGKTEQGRLALKNSSKLSREIDSGSIIADLLVMLTPWGVESSSGREGGLNRASKAIVVINKKTGLHFVQAEVFTDLDKHEFLKSILLYINSSNADIILGTNSSEYIGAVRQMRRFPPGHKRRKIASQTIRSLENARILGSRITYINRHERGVGESSPHGSPSPHWRRGHYRLQHFGRENSESKIIYIAPTGVCMPDFENKQKTYKVV